jgi:hypothetical protein
VISKFNEEKKFMKKKSSGSADAENALGNRGCAPAPTPQERFGNFDLGAVKLRLREENAPGGGPRLRVESQFIK